VSRHARQSYALDPRLRGDDAPLLSRDALIRGYEKLLRNFSSKKTGLRRFF